MKWARFHQNGYECSSRGDKRFSALFAQLKDGRTIEEAYQLDVKGYRAVSDNWRDAKGQKPILNISNQERWTAYLQLWRTWVEENPEDFQDLILQSEGKVLTDQFATSPVNQARALAELISEVEWNNANPFQF